MKTGIYQISNIESIKCYLGSAAGEGGFTKRWDKHISALKRNDHSNRHLQNAWNKYGESVFLFEVLEYVVRLDEMTDEEWKTLILEKEQHYLDTILFASCNDDRFHELGYNICRKAGNLLGFRHTEESKAKMSRVQKGRKVSEATKAKLSIINKGKKHTQATRKKMSESHKGTKNHMFGKHLSDEAKAKSRKAHQGKKASDATKAKMSKARMNNTYAAHASKSDVCKIRFLFKQGWSYTRVANKLGFSYTVIYNIGTGRSWSHLKEIPFEVR